MCSFFIYCILFLSAVPFVTSVFNVFVLSWRSKLNQLKMLRIVVIRTNPQMYHFGLLIQDICVSLFKENVKRVRAVVLFTGTVNLSFVFFQPLRYDKWLLELNFFIFKQASVQHELYINICSYLRWTVGTGHSKWHRTSTDNVLFKGICSIIPDGKW